MSSSVSMMHLFTCYGEDSGHERTVTTMMYNLHGMNLNNSHHTATCTSLTLKQTVNNSPHELIHQLPSSKCQCMT